MPSNDVPPPAININSVALANAETNISAVVGFGTNFGSFAGEIELLASDPTNGSESFVRLALANNQGKIWEMAVPELLVNLLRPLMGWTGSGPGPNQTYAHQTPLLSASMLPVSGGTEPFWTFEVTGTIYCKHVDATEVLPVEIAHTLLINHSTITMMSDHQ